MPKCKKNSSITNELLNKYSDALMKTVIRLALEGNACALRLCIERLIPKISDDVSGARLPEDDPDLLKAKEVMTELVNKYRRDY